MERKHDRSFVSVRKETSDAFRGAGHDVRSAVAVIADAAARGLAASARARTYAADTLETLAAAVAGGAAESGGNPACAAEGFLFGVMKSGLASERPLFALVETAANAFVRASAETGLDVGAAAVGLSDAAAAWAPDAGPSGSNPGSPAPQGAVDAPHPVGPGGGRVVREALNGKSKAHCP